MIGRLVARGLATAVCGLAILVVAEAAWAQAWPQRTVRIISPFAAGGGTDAFARPLVVRLTQELGQTVIVENQAGAGGTVGAAGAARAAADGYTWLMGAVHHAIAESVFRNLTYKLETDLVPVTLVASVPQVIVTHPKTGFKTLMDLLDRAKASPGKLNFGSAGYGTAHHLAGELFRIATKTEITHVPFRGAGPMMQDLLAGHVDLAFDGMGTSAAQIKAGRLVPLAVMVPARTSALPDVPTLAESGVAGVEVATWYGLWAPKGTPAPIIARMHQAVAKSLQHPDIREVWASQAATAGGQSPEEFGRFITAEIAKWAKIVKEADIKVE